MESLGLVLALVVLATGKYNPVKEHNEHPYIVSIHRDAVRRNYLCAGSLIATTWVLTTTNCLTKLAFKVRYGDMMTRDNATYSQILQRIHHRNSRSYHQAKEKNRLTPKSNNIGLALIEEATNVQVGVLSGIDYSAILGQKVTYFEFGFLPVYKAKIYETNKVRMRYIIRTPKLKSVTEGDVNNNNITIDNPSNRVILVDTKVLRIGDGIAIKCHNADHPGPNICVATKCFDFQSISDPRVAHVIPDYGAPLIHDKRLVGVTSEVERYYTRYTPVSPYLDWIRKHMNQVPTPKR